MAELKFCNFLEKERSLLVFNFQVGEVGAEPGAKGRKVLQRVKWDHMWVVCAKL